ncbi:hypothetical protein [Marixanthomonas spongiae]|uniref:Uncharacterized protein n=1 Tax=Marixanthomonas spongiae TaxID=2174845 RepID=A0A2U0HZS2_9FLAO|nr:hypothetical protein [Marixanthomonas spongiae]PVW14329.1 hypothetical protein DDV96_11055 [Marixanthomonas spongiae]
MKPTTIFKQTLFLITVFLALTNGIAQVGINTTTPAGGSMLDVNSTNKGMLVPRVDIVDLNTIAPVTGGNTESLLVYNTNSTTGKGFHYWNGLRWVNIGNTVDDDWSLTGNAGTDEATNFMGTTDNRDVIFKTNGNENMRINSSGGQLLIGKTTQGSANDLLQVLSDIEIGGAASNFDYGSENIQMTGQSGEWNINVKNHPDPNSSSFYIGTTERENTAGLIIAPNGDVKVGKSSDTLPLSEFHVVNNQHNKATTIRIDNTSTVQDHPHTALEFWDGQTHLKSFIRHNNRSDVLEIGHDESDGIVHFYSGDSNGSNSAITMTMDNENRVGIGTQSPYEILDVNGDVDIGSGTTGHDGDGENIQFRAQSQEWFISAENAPTAEDSDFYISTIQRANNAQFKITPAGNVNIGRDTGGDPRDILHITRDQDAATTIRIDNTNNGTSTTHQALELWDGSNTGTVSSGLQAFFRNNNNSHTLQIGHNKSDGVVEFYSGNNPGSNSGNSRLNMTLQNDGDVEVHEDLEVAESVTIGETIKLKPLPVKAAADGVAGEIYFNGDDNTLYVHNGTNWVALH